MMISWPSTSLERLLYTLIGLAAWQWAILTAVWYALFPRKRLKREGNKLVRIQGMNNDE